MKKATPLVIVMLAGLAASAAAATDASERAELTIEEFLAVPVLGSASLSPDGAQVAYLRSQRDLEEDRRSSDLWLADVASGTVRRLSYHEDGARDPAWRPDGVLSFLSSRGGSPQVWINPLDGSEPRPVTELEQGVQAFWWAPDSRRLAVLATVKDEDEVEEGDTEESEGDAGEEQGEESDEAEDWTVYDRLEDPEQYPQLWILSTTDEGPGEEEPRRLTSPPVNVHHVDWSPNGRRLAVTYQPRFSGLVDEDLRIALVDAEGHDSDDVLEPFTPADRHASLAVFSPDGRRLAYFMDRRAELRAYLNLKDLIVRDLTLRTETMLTAGSQLSHGGSGSTPESAPVWSADGSFIYLEAADGTSLDVYRVAVKGGPLERVTSLAGNLRSVSISGATLAYVESELHRPGALWTGPLDGSAQARRLDETDSAVARFGLVAPEKLRLPGHEGGFVEGYLFLPPGAAREGKHPTVIEMHGGPYSRYGNAWSTRYPWHVLARQGLAVFIANPRGGTGYGEEFLRGVYRGFGTDDCQDLLAAVDALVERGIADPDRLGFTGYSYGGLMTNAVISTTDRFKAAVSIAGIFNYVSAMGQSNPQLLIDSYRQPWAGDLELMWRQSPASRAHLITTPTLIMHGTDDEPVDPRQSKELFTYLQLNGTPSRLILYPGEGHGIDRPSHMVDYQTRELEWFRHYLLGDEDAAGAAEPVPVEATARE